MRKKLLSVVTVFAVIAAGLIGLETTSASAADRLPPTTATTDTKLRCRANAPIVGWVDADQTIGGTVTGPKYIEQGGTFQLVSEGSDTTVPADFGGQTVVALKNILNKTRLAGGFTIVSAVGDGPGSYKATPSSPPTAIPGGLTISTTATDVTMSLPGPFPANSTVSPPDLIITVLATGAPGTVITSKVGGTLPSANPTSAMPDPGFSLTAQISGIAAGDVPTYCAPNYGTFANSNGEPFGVQPALSSTTITPNTNPLVDITSPEDGAKYLPDAAIFADYACTETVYALESCVATTPDGEQLDFSTFGLKTFTVTATDANGGVTTKTVNYEVGGNVIPTVDAGADITTNGGSTVTLSGSATDPDTGQILSYEWTQIAGPPVTINPADAADPFLPTNRFVAPRNGPVDLTFRLRVDDQFGTGEDTVNVHVNANNGPVITNGASQTVNNVKTGATVFMTAAATDPEGDTPITYAWSQVDDHGAPLPVDDPLHVTLSSTNTAATAFAAPEGPGTLYLQGVATDALGASATTTVTVTVLANNPPVITAGPNQTLNNIKTNALVTLNGAATDPDNAAPSAGHVLTYNWSQVDENGDPLELLDPDTVTLSSQTVSNPTFTSPLSPATLHFKVQVSDSYDTTVGNVTVNVVGSEAPVANAGPDQNVGRGALVTLDGSGSSDPDLDPITYAWTQVDAAGDPLTSGPDLVTLSGGGAVQKPTFTSPASASTLHFQLRVTDNNSLTSPPDTVDITVLANSAPTANAGPAQTNKNANAVVTLTGAASTDPDAGESASLTYAWTQVDPLTDLPIGPGPSQVTLSDAAAVSPTFAAPHVSPATTLKFQLIVTDINGAPSAPAFTTVAINVNRAPTAGAVSVTPAQTSRTIGATITLTAVASATDLDGDLPAGFTYQWIQTASAAATTGCAPSCPVANVTLTPSSAGRIATFPAPAFLASGQQLFFRNVVNDGFGATATGANLTVGLQNSLPTARFTARGTGTPATSGLANDANANRVYIGQPVQLDGTKDAAGVLTSDPDGGTTFTYAWRHVTATGGNTNCSSNCIFGGATATSSAAQPSVTIPTGAGSLFMRLTVTDVAGGASTTVNFTITKVANTAPVVTANGGPAFVDINTADVAISGTATDADTTPVQTLTYQWTQVDGAGVALAPSDPLFVTLTGATTLSPTFTAPATPGIVHFKLTASDGTTTASATKNITITPGANPPPIANAGPDQTGIDAGATVTLDGTGSSDPEGQTFTYAWTQVDGAGDPLTSGPDHVTLTGATTAHPTFTAPANGPSTLHFRLVVTDQFDEPSAPDTVDIAVDANGIPTANAGPDQSGITAGATVTLDGTGSTDPESKPLTYAWTQVDGLGDPLTTGPDHVTLTGATTAHPTYTSPPAGSGLLHFSLIVTDNFGAASPADTVDISSTGNGTPTANAGPDQTGINAGVTVTLDGTGSTDPETQALTYAWTQVDGLGDPLTTGPDHVTLTGATTAHPTFPAPPNSSGTLHFSLVVTDTFGAASSADTVDIGVNTNGTPTANAGPDQSGIIAGATVTLDGSGSSDPEGGVVTYAWTQVDGAGDPVPAGPGQVALSSSTAQKPTFAAPATGPLTLHFRLIVSDPFGAASTADTVDIAVNANTTPVANAGPNQAGIAPNTLVTLDGSASADADGHTFTYAWTQVDGSGNPITPTVTLSSSTAQKPTFTSPGSPIGSTLRFRLVVTDQFGAVSTPSIVIISVGSNTRPVANAGPDQTPGRGKVVTLDGSGSTDPEGQAITYQWVQVNSLGTPILPSNPLAVTLSNDTAQKPTFTAPIPAAYPASLFFRLYVTDAPGLISDPDSVEIHLVESSAPTANAGPNQTNKATNSVTTLTGAASTDPDSDTLTYAWSQVDALGDPLAPGDPTAVTLTTPSNVTSTFVAPHFAASTTLRFKLVVTDVPYGLSSAPAFVTVQINANRAPAVGAPSVTPASRPVGTNVTITVPVSAADADGDPVAGFTYQWIQTASAADTTACAPSCPVANVTLTPVPGTPRSATYTAPAATAAGQSLFFRLTVADGFGASIQSANLTVALTNSAPVVPATMQIRAGIDGSVVNPTRIYVGDSITVSAPSTDADGTALTYAWSGRPCGGLGESLGCLLAGNNDSGYPGGSCRGITITNDPVTPGKASFTAPTFGANNPNRCGLRVVVTDATGATATRDFPILDLIANNPPVAVISPVGDKILASTPAGPSITSLSGSLSTDPNTNPPQPHSYAWEILDATTNTPLPVSSPARGTFSSPDSINTTWTAPSTAPYSIKFQLTVDDGMSLPSVATTGAISITTTRPGANAGSDHLVHPTQIVDLDGSGSTDPGGRPLTYSWAQISGPPVTLTTPLSAHAGFTAPHLNFPLTNTTVSVFELTTRNGLTTSFDTVTVINEPWAQAVANAGADQTVQTATAGVVLNGSASSTESPGALTYAWTQTGGTTVALSSTTAQSPTFTAPTRSQAQGPETLTFSLVVADGYSTSEADSTSVTVNPNLEVPGPVSNVVAAPGNAQATVTFDPPVVDGGSPIVVYVVSCTSSNGGVAKGAFSAPSGVTVTGLTNGKTYTCAVAGVNAQGTGPAVASNAFIPSAPPSPPTNLTAVTGNGSAIVSFTPGANGGEPNVTYLIECASSNGGATRSGFTTTSPVTIASLTNAKTYTCRAQAFHSLGTSAPSAPSSSFVVGVPAKPAGPTAEPGATTATVSWVAPANNGAAITGYTVTPYIGATAQAPRVFITAATSQIITGLTNGTTYTFTVAATNPRGTGITSEKSAPTTVGTPSAPPAVSGQPGAAQATLTWTAPANNGAAITGYSVTPFIGAVAQPVRLFASAATTQVITGLTNGTTYTFSVSAVNSRGTGPGKVSGPITVGAPTAPALVTATAGNDQATVTWSAPASNNGSAITNYRVTAVKAGVDQAPITYNASALTRVLISLTQGVSYTFKVEAINARGASPFSILSNAVTPT